MVALSAGGISMNQSIGGLVVCLLGLVACNVEHYDDCDGDSFDYGDDIGGSHSRAGASSTGGTPTGGGTAGSSKGGSAPGEAGGEASGGGTGPVVVPPRICDEESDCEPGFNCDLEQQQCLPADEETCAELKTEAACTHRSDCTPIYAGTNCSCGQDCECKGGEPGCVCESFAFFVCEAAN
jgi:hypothetical protein